MMKDRDLKLLCRFDAKSPVNLVQLWLLYRSSLAVLLRVVVHHAVYHKDPGVRVAEDGESLCPVVTARFRRLEGKVGVQLSCDRKGVRAMVFFRVDVVFP